MLDMAWIRERVAVEEFYISRHGDQERQNDNLTVSNIREALLTGVVIEHYEDTGRGISCLIAGFTRPVSRFIMFADNEAIGWWS